MLTKGSLDLAMKSVTRFQFNHVDLTAPPVILQDSYILSTLCNLSGYYDSTFDLDDGDSSFDGARACLG